LRGLPLSYVRQPGLEPGTYGLEGRCSIQLSYWRNVMILNRDGQIRTGDPSLPKRVLYRTEPRPAISLHRATNLDLMGMLCQSGTHPCLSLLRNVSCDLPDSREGRLQGSRAVADPILLLLLDFGEGSAEFGNVKKGVVTETAVPA
jgi:hypothetical protein